MNYFFYLITDLFHFVKIILICRLFFELKRHYKKIEGLLAILLAFLASTCIYLWHNDTLGMSIYFLAVCSVMQILYKEKIHTTIIWAVWIILVTSMIDIMFTVFVQVWCDIVNVSNDRIEQLVASILSMLFLVGIGELYARKYKMGVKGIGWREICAFSVLIIADTFVIMVMSVVVLDEVSGLRKILYSSTFIMVVLGIFIQLSMVVLLFSSRNIYRDKEKLSEKYLNEQNKYYEYLEKRERETKKFRHDLKDHMETLSALAEKEAIDEFNKYLETINIKINSFGNAISLGNGIVEAIVNKYYFEALQNNINMKVRGVFPNSCNITAYDLCTIFSNLLSNAIEAAVDSKEKAIDLNCRYTEKKVIIVVENTFVDEGQFEDKIIQSRKKDKTHHGFGLENIGECVEKYNGVMNIKIVRQKFVVTIALKYIEKGNYENSNS